jgi:hypothetical protein
MTEGPGAPISLPHVFYVDIRYRVILGVLTILGVLGSSYISQHQPRVGIIFWALTGLYLLLLALMLSLRLQVDTDGLLQRWLFSGTRIYWKQVTRLSRTRRAYGVYGPEDKELVLLAFFSPPAQAAIAGQIIDRARLRKCPGQTAPPILEQWERKK